VSTVTKAVILARGLGTRMRREEAASALDASQRAIADTGMKAMIPIGRPFLDYVLSALADAGFREACLVIGPEHRAIRDHYASLRTQRIRISFAVQVEPLGTADAVLAAETFASGEPFVVLNADNYYSIDVLSALREARPPALPGFSATALTRDGNLAPARVASFPVVVTAPDGSLERLVEDHESGSNQSRGDYRVSMNCWLFDSRIFDACRQIERSGSGELELPEAVRYLIRDRTTDFKVIPVDAPVLDLTSRGDIAVVAERLRDVAVCL
jgi:glucose-1-phosphate thymidylyltransferase